MHGKTNGISYYQPDSNAADTIVWADQTTFREDLAAMYPALDATVSTVAPVPTV